MFSTSMFSLGVWVLLYGHGRSGPKKGCIQGSVREFGQLMMRSIGHYSIHMTFWRSLNLSWPPVGTSTDGGRYGETALDRIVQTYGER